MLRQSHQSAGTGASRFFAWVLLASIGILIADRVGAPVGAWEIADAAASEDQDFKPLAGIRGLGDFGPSESEVTVSGRLIVDPNKRDGVLQVRADLGAGWHIYSQTQKKPLMATVIELESTSQLTLVGPFIPDRAPDSRMTPDFDVPLEDYSGKVVWSAPVAISADVNPELITLRGVVKGQVCNEARGCVPVGRNNGSFSVSFAEYADLASHLQPRASRAVDPALVPPGPVGPGGTATAPAVANAAPGDGNARGATTADAGSIQLFSLGKLLVVLAQGFAGGLLLNLMPCVLPVIGLKVMSFAQQAGESRRQVIMLNVYFVAGIVAVFMVLAALAAVLGWGWGSQFQRPGYGIALAVILFVFALSFLGVWEVPIPGFVGSGSTAKAASKEGPTGAFAKGILTTLLATPCGAPFVAPTLAWAVSQNMLVIFAVFLSMGLGMGAPYVAFGLFPGLMRALPKPGAWMDTFKQAMGFVLLATVVWILFFVDQIDHAYVLPTVATMFAFWAGCWWIGRTPITASTFHKTAVHVGAVTCATGLGAMMFLFLGPTVTPSTESGWGSYSPAALAELRAEGRPVFVDFTAAWCLSCKANERLALHGAKTAEYLQENNIAVLVADKTKESPEIDQLLKELGNHGGVIPFYAIYPPEGGKPIVFNDVPLTRSRLIDYFEQAIHGEANEMVGTHANSTPATTMQ